MARTSASKEKEVVHLRLDPEIVKAIDAFAFAWGVSRTEAAEMLIDRGIYEHRDTLVEVMQTMLKRFSEEYDEPPATPEVVRAAPTRERKQKAITR